MGTPATTLAEAAGASFDNLSVKWLTGQLNVTLTTFWPLVMNIFPESDQRGRPVANWGQVLACTAALIPPGIAPLDDLNRAAGLVYRLCWMGQALQTDGQITSTQATALLAAYNSTIVL